MAGAEKVGKKFCLGQLMSGETQPMTSYDYSFFGLSAPPDVLDHLFGPSKGLALSQSLQSTFSAAF